MSTMYVLVRNGFEYNDEIMYRPEVGGGDPVKVFHDKELAELYCKRKNIESMRKERIGEYCYGFDEINSRNNGPSLQDVLTNCGIDPDNSWDADFSKVTDEQWEQIYDATSLRFFEVVAVDDVLPPELVKQAVLES